MSLQARWLIPEPAAAVRHPPRSALAAARRFTEAFLMFFDLRLPDIDLCLDLFCELLLQCHFWILPCELTSMFLRQIEISNRALEGLGCHATARS